MILNILLGLNIASADNQTSLGVKNNVHVYQKKEACSSLYAFKGEGTTALSVPQLIGVLRNESISKEWVDMMVFATVVEQYSDTHMVLHQGYDLPWPVSDSDYVFDKKIVIDDNNKSTVHLTSVEHPKVPVTSDYVRARRERTFWQFSVMANGHTQVTVEVLTDPDGSLPDWTINSIQADWPHKTINASLQRASQGDIIPDPSYSA